MGKGIDVEEGAEDRDEEGREKEIGEGRGEEASSLESPACNATKVDSHARGGLRPTTLRSRR